jgi:hypothetical protein
MSPQSLVVALPVFRFRDRTQTHHTGQDSSGRAISPSQRPLHANTQQSQQKEYNVAGGIQTRDTNRRAAADPHLRLPVAGNWVWWIGGEKELDSRKGLTLFWYTASRHVGHNQLSTCSVLPIEQPGRKAEL